VPGRSQRRLHILPCERFRAECLLNEIRREATFRALRSTSDCSAPPLTLAKGLVPPAAGGVANGAPQRAERKGPTGGWVE
jgi:hypothetical protein